MPRDARPPLWRRPTSVYNGRVTFKAEFVEVSRFFAACMVILLAAPVGLAAAQEMSKVPGSRSESLELPGLTAGCHICEWRPRANQMPAADQCGTDASGAAKVGLFKCGFAQDCQRECHFLRCGSL
jgi:hypothetical protein